MLKQYLMGLQICVYLLPDGPDETGKLPEATAGSTSDRRRRVVSTPE